MAQPDLARLYATYRDVGGDPKGSGASSSRPKKRGVGLLADDGRYQWGDLTGREKVARATQQSVNFAVVCVGAVLTGGVFYLLWTEVISPNSKTWQFEKAVGRIKDDARCMAVLGERGQIAAFGDSTGSRWSRNKPIATTVEKDNLGREHMKLSFHVEGPLNSGIVHVHMLKPQGSYEWEYLLLALDVKGHTRIVLERHTEKNPLSLLGIRWR
ncbi:protein tim21 [Aspergillus ruber CBS 135680]|uniref:Mitochondrial import inner membrane translocase subunit Tim21 n=1 Tax=Aspergillus ruber (strain CBS 135680) TaxID=1388766 RepID=A0A017SFC8_ASPRC|nr:TIM21-domain-containing protein [Aspergillus ruber CBS 135680]EYE95647.1 TIM21-domain-containing protein [Aspergillus ruber CBS 135680]